MSSSPIPAEHRKSCINRSPAPTRFASSCHGMNKAALLNFAETTYGERLDKRQNEETIRHKVISLFSQREMDKDTGDAD